MAILRTHGIEIHSLFPNEDWYNEGNEVIDETTEKGQALVEKILTLVPFCTLIRDSVGNIIDAEDNLVARQTWEQEQQRLRDEHERTRPPSQEERLEAIESALLTMLLGGVE